MQKVVVITGASKGIGRATAEKFASEGYLVYDLSRSGKSDEICTHIDCDVSDYEQIDGAIKEIYSQTSRIDVAISNAGFGISGSMEASKYEMIKSQIDVNFTGSAFFARAVLEYIRESKGRILFMSSMAAVIPIPFQTLYSATKSAIMTMTMALDNELRGSGARAIALLPGDLATNFTASRLKADIEPDFYKERVSRSVGKMESDEMGGKQPDYIANRLYRLATSRNPKVIGSLGPLYRFGAFAVKVAPVRFANWVIWKMYAK